MRIELDKMHVRPDFNFIRSGNAYYKYQKFYFSKGKAEKLLNFSKGIILLHNSWTPIKYKNMSEEKFLHLDIMISEFFRLILKKNIVNKNI